MKISPISRRRFIAATSAVSFAPYFIPSTVLGKDGGTAPSNRITMGCIGLGWQGPWNMEQFMKEEDCQVIAVCDVDTEHLKEAKGKVDTKYANQDCKAYADFRQLLSRKDIDAVMLALPDHWHSIPAILAAESGKDIWGEKPLSHTFIEGQKMVAAVNKHKRIWQTGSWQRSVFNFRQGVELVLNGHIGKVQRVEVGLPAGHTDFNKTGDQTQPTNPPPTLDYDRWLGPAPQVPYIPARHHKNWRWSYYFGGGQLMDWIGHHCDIAHWGMGMDHSGPVEVKGAGEFPLKDAVWNTATQYRVECKYANGIEMVIAGGHEDIKGGTKWIGEKGWVHVNRGVFEASNPEWVKPNFDRGSVKLPAPKNHHRNFLDCVKSRHKTLTPAEVAHRSATPGHLGMVAMLTGRTIKWDPKKEKIIGDEGAQKLLGVEMRAPWKQ